MKWNWKSSVKILSVLVLCFILACLTMGADGCGDSQEEKDSAVVENQQSIYGINQPIPMFNWSQDRDNLIQIYILKNECRSTFSIISSMSGETKMIFASKGFPIPADTQMTNPLQTMNGYYSGSVIEQAEPNGLFTSKNTDGTYVLYVRKNGDVAPVYTELKVTTFPFQIRVNPQTGMWEEVEDSVSQFTINVNRKPKDLPTLANQAELDKALKNCQTLQQLVEGPNQ